MRATSWIGMGALAIVTSVAVACGDDGRTAIDEDAGPMMMTDGGGGVDAGPGACPEGYAGPTCEECASGYQDEDGDGECRLGCDATGELALDCNGHGTCMVESSGSRYCECDELRGGDRCDACVPGFALEGDECVLGSPPEDGMFLWLDADDVSSVALGGEGGISSGGIDTWTDRRGGTGSMVFEAPATDNQPTHVPDVLNGRRVVRFDGTDDWMAGGGIFFTEGMAPLQNEDEYTIFIVGYAAGSSQVLLSGANGDDHGLLVQSDGEGDLRFLHRAPVAAVSSDTDDDLYTEGGAYSRTQAQLITLVHTDTEHAATAGISTPESMEVLSEPYDAALTFVLGRLKAVDTGMPRYLDGDLAEVIIYERTLTEREMTHVQSYLSAKWGLR